MLQKLTDVINGNPWLKAQGVGVNLERLLGSPWPLIQGTAEQLVDHFFESSARAAGLFLKFEGNIFIQGQSRSHIMTLCFGHHDVKREWKMSLWAATRGPGIAPAPHSPTP